MIFKEIKFINYQELDTLKYDQANIKKNQIEFLEMKIKLIKSKKFNEQI
jgi:hypothetical protein